MLMLKGVASAHKVAKVGRFTMDYILLGKAVFNYAFLSALP